jgi:diacylglycerol kinase family enzyme
LGPAYLYTFLQLLRDSAAGIQGSLITMQSSWFAYESESEIHVNLDGEPAMVKRFQVKARKRLLPVRLGDSDLLSN